MAIESERLDTEKQSIICRSCRSVPVTSERSRSPTPDKRIGRYRRIPNWIPSIIRRFLSLRTDGRTYTLDSIVSTTSQKPVDTIEKNTILLLKWILLPQRKPLLRWKSASRSKHGMSPSSLGELYSNIPSSSSSCFPLFSCCSSKSERSRLNGSLGWISLW